MCSSINNNILLYNRMYTVFCTLNSVLHVPGMITKNYYLIVLCKTRIFVFRFETETRVEYPETIWNLNSYSHNAEQNN